MDCRKTANSYIAELQVARFAGLQNQQHEETAQSGASVQGLNT